jgi:glutamate synthase (NADPH/NADH) large chain
MLITVDGADRIVYDRYKPRNVVPDTLDAQIVKDAHRFLEDGEKMQLSYAVQNTYRTIGTRTSSHIVQAFGMRNQLQPDHLTVMLEGSAGQSLGAFAAPGLKLVVAGRRQRLRGQGPVGRDHRGAPRAGQPAEGGGQRHHRQHGALRRDRRLPLRLGPGRERFAVRNSGAKVVVEGVRLQRVRIHDRRRRRDPRRSAPISAPA